MERTMEYYHNYGVESFGHIKDMHQQIPRTNLNEELQNAAVFWHTNIERKRYGLKQLQYHPKLEQMATTHSYQMRKYSFFDHENNFETRYHTLTDRLESMKDDAFHGFNSYGENIAEYPTIPSNLSISFSPFRRGVQHMYGPDGREILPYTYYDMAQSVVDGWMHSPGHRKNILNPDFIFLGCGCAAFETNSNGLSVTYLKLTQNFGGTEFLPSITDKFKQHILSGNNPHTSVPNKSMFNALFGDWGQNKSTKSMKENIFFGDGESPENGQEKTLCVFLLDNSGSMGGSKIAGLNKGLLQFHRDIIESDTLSQRLEVAVISFETSVQYLQQPALGETFTMPTLVAMGGTNMAEGIQKAIEVVEERKKYYKDHGIAYKRPWIVMITDGQASVSSIKDKVKKDGEDKHYFFQPIAIDEGSDMNLLNSLATTKAFMLKDQKFSSFFEWLSKSLEIIATADIGSDAKLDNPFETFAAC